MTREIKFRGKRIKAEDKLERWIEGSYIEYTNIHNDKVIRIVSKSGYQNEVYIDTIGQFTGLHDKNGKEIYEGDIVQMHIENGNILLVVTWNLEVGAWLLKLKGCNIEGVRTLGEWLRDSSSVIQVVGNIYDNPELLEE